MPLNLQAVGQKTTPIRIEFSWEKAVLYALSVGETRLEYLYEREGPRPLPGYLSVLGFEASRPLFAEVGGRMEQAMVGEQGLKVFKPIPATRLWVESEVEGIFSLGPLGMAVFASRFYTETDIIGSSRCTLYFPGLAPEHAHRPPRSPKSIPPTTPPDWEQSYTTLPTQAALFRLLGDSNPLHIDPKAAALVPETGGKPILHGLCTFGIACRLLGDFKRFSCRFARPVWPGETLVVSGWQDQKTVRVRTQERFEEDILSSVLLERG
jgi:acyl dehydratase